MTEPNLLELEAKATDPSRYSVQAVARNTPFAPTSDVQGGGIFWLSVAGQAHDDAPAWNAVYPNWRDRYLLEFARSEGMIASAKYAMKTRIGTLNYTLSGPPRAKKYAAALLESPGMNSTLSQEVQKLSDDLDGSDNGAFMELWRAGNPLSDAGTRPVLGFSHLDSRQCWRSYDPEFPVWYTNPVTGLVRKIHRSRIVFSSDNPQPVELARGIGFCAVSRALRMARVFRNMQIFLDEKVGGRFTRAIGAVSGITPKQLREALNQNDSNADDKGFVVYKEIPYIVNPNLDAGSEIKIVMQDLASIPDGFVFRDDADLYAYILAFCFGVDAREFWPATQSGATKADASVQNMKARGKGIGNRIETIEYMIRRALPETVTLEYDYTDDEQDRQVAEIHKIETDTLKVYFDMGALRSDQVQALAIAKGILDGALLATLQQPLTSDDNPETATDAPTEEPVEDGQSDSVTINEKRSDNKAFVYVPLPNDVAILEIQGRLKTTLGINGIEYQDPETFHVTLLYCNEADDSALQQVIQSSPVSLPLTIESNKLGVFENGEERALYLEVERDTNLITLQSNVYTAFAQNGLSNQLSSFSQPGAYKPHITLAYLPAGVDIPNIAVNLKTSAKRYAFGRNDYQIVASKKKDQSKKTYSDYRRSLRALTRGYWNGALSAFDFTDGMVSAVIRHFERAWQQVEKQYGIATDERTTESQQRLNLAINTEISYISGFADAIAANSKANGGALQPLFDRADLWAAGYDRTITLAQSVIGGNLKLKWIRDPEKDSCADCIQYDGLIFYQSEWDEAGVRPKGDMLECLGILCGCTWEVTTERKTRGNPPALIGHKHLHAH